MRCYLGFIVEDIIHVPFDDASFANELISEED